MQTAKINGLFQLELHEAGLTSPRARLDADSKHLDYDIRREALAEVELRARFFLWALTPDRSAQGRPVGEHNFQL
jgi:hypothetical protein